MTEKQRYRVQALRFDVGMMVTSRSTTPQELGVYVLELIDALLDSDEAEDEL